MPELHASAGPRVLLVEDDAAIRDTLAELLRDEGCAVTPVPHGREALNQLRRSALPDVIVLDLMMPVMDGWEFRVEQKADPVLSRIPVIAMSADVSAKARAIAADAYVRKPIEIADLYGRIRSVVGHATRQRLAAADRMAALGTLASGIAHEINNPLTYVLANLQVMRERLPPSLGAQAAELRELVEDTMDGAERIRRIVKQAQMVAPVQPEERETVVDLRAALEAALTLAANEIRHRARLVRDIEGAACVRGDRGRVEQLFLNLLLNAAHAIAEGHAAENEIRVALRPSSPGRALIEIADTGCGIPAEVQERVFQPFFTTKPVGQGTGLGLSICQGIVTALGGEITFESAPDQGTVFRVIVPVIPGQPADGAAVQSVRAPQAAAARRVLVVDSETSILRAVRQILEPVHEVTTTTDGEAALALARSGRGFDVILCDLTLAAMNGMDLVGELERTHPELARRVVFMTAGAFTPRARQCLERHPWLAKPFDRQQLVAVIEGRQA